MLFKRLFHETRIVVNYSISLFRLSQRLNSYPYLRHNTMGKNSVRIPLIPIQQSSTAMRSFRKIRQLSGFSSRM